MTSDNMYPVFKRDDDGFTLTMTIEDIREQEIKDLKITNKSLMEANQNLRGCCNCANWDIFRGCSVEKIHTLRSHICERWELPEDWR